jgi:chorismate mutase (EC 5.4.99.5)
MRASIRALRGATTVVNDTEEQVTAKVQELLREMISSNEIKPADIVSILFTATSDISSMFPAAAARQMGLVDIPMMCAKELDVVGALERCIRVMMHVSTDKPREAMRHVYLHEARNLRPDLD